MAGDYSGVEGEEGGRVAYRVAENPGGDRQGVREGVDSPQGINTPGVEEFPQGDKPLEWPLRGRECRGRTDGGREGT